MCPRNWSHFCQRISPSSLVAGFSVHNTLGHTILMMAYAHLETLYPLQTLPCYYIGSWFCCEIFAWLEDSDLAQLPKNTSVNQKHANTKNCKSMKCLPFLWSLVHATAEGQRSVGQDFQPAWLLLLFSAPRAARTTCSLFLFLGFTGTHEGPCQRWLHIYPFHL